MTERNMLKAFCRYVRNHGAMILFADALLLLVWGSWILNANIRVDTELVINYPRTILNWAKIGRQGGLLTQDLLGICWFNQYLSTTAGCLLLCLAGNLYSFLLCEFTGEDRRAYLLFGLLLFTYPAFAEQFYFTLQILDVGVGFALLAVGVYYAFRFAMFHRPGDALLSGVPLIWAFSTYQALVPMYIALVAMGVILLTSSSSGESSALRWGRLGILCLHFVGCYLANSLITRLWFSRSTYLDDQILWLTVPASQCFRNILDTVADGFTGKGTFNTVFFGVFSLLALVFTPFRWHRMNGGSGSKALLLLAVVGFQLVPFFLTVYLGHSAPVRAQFSYSLVMAGNIMYLLSGLPRDWERKAVFVLMLCSLWLQIGTTLRLEYTDNFRNEQDVAMMRAIAEDVLPLCRDGKPVCIVGISEASLNGACLEGELIGKSFFEWDALCGEDLRSTNQVRLRGMAHALGINLSFVLDADQITEASKLGETLSVWPAAGCIMVTDDCVIVRVGN